VRESASHRQDARLETKGCQVLGARQYAAARKVFAVRRELLEVDPGYPTSAGHDHGNSSCCSLTEKLRKSDAGH